MIHLYGRGLHCNAQVFMGGQISHADRFVLNARSSDRFVLLQVEHTGCPLLLGISAGPVGTTRRGTVGASSSRVSASAVSSRGSGMCWTVALLARCGWSGHQVWRVFSHVLDQIRLLEKEEQADT